MSQYAYILVVISLVFLFLLNKYEKERLQKLYQEQLLKDETFRADIKEKFTRLKISMMSLLTSIKLIIWECCYQKDITDQLK